MGGDSRGANGGDALGEMGEWDQTGCDKRGVLKWGVLKWGVTD